MRRWRTQRRSTGRQSLLAAVLLLALTSTAFAEPAAVPAPEAAPGLERQSPRPPPAPEPALACYRAAQAGQGDAYQCDLALQIARDSGSARAVAAALVNRALVLAGDGRLEPAMTDLDAALQLAPDDPAIHGNRGNLLLRMGRSEEALRAHDQAVTLAPNDPVSYYNRAFSYLALGADDRAEQDLAAARGLLRRGERLRPAGIAGPAAPPGP